MDRTKQKDDWHGVPTNMLWAVVSYKLRGLGEGGLV